MAVFVAERDFLPGDDAPWIDERVASSRRSDFGLWRRTQPLHSGSVRPNFRRRYGPVANSFVWSHSERAATKSSCEP